MLQTIVTIDSKKVGERKKEREKEIERERERKRDRTRDNIKIYPTNELYFR